MGWLPVLDRDNPRLRRVDGGQCYTDARRELLDWVVEEVDALVDGNQAQREQARILVVKLANINNLVPRGIYDVVGDGLNIKLVKRDRDGRYATLREARVGMVNQLRCCYEDAAGRGDFSLCRLLVSKIAWVINANLGDFFPEDDAEWYRLVTGRELPTEEVD